MRPEVGHMALLTEVFTLMPANLTPQFRKAEEEYRQAQSVPAKIEALEEMLRLIPKHKGTEHVQGDIKRRLAKLRTAAVQKKGKGGPDPFHIEKHGAGQIVTVGAPNSGKSALVAAVTKARTNVAAFPFATHAPVPGMVLFEDVQVQLVDMPPVTADGFIPGMIGALRNADALAVCLDLSADDLLEQSDTCFGAMSDRGLVRQGEELEEGFEAKPMLVVGTKMDAAGAADNLQVLRELRPDLAAILPVSAETGEGLERFAADCFEILDVVRVYSKQPGKPADIDDPFTLRRGSTVMDLAAAIHRDMVQELKYARIWGSGKFDGQTVQRDHVLADRDVVELHV